MTKRITDTSIKQFLATSDKEWCFDSRRVEFRANKLRTGGTFYDVVYKGHRKIRTPLGKWPALKASDLFKRLSEIRAQVMAGERTGKKFDTVTDCGALLLWFVEHIQHDKTFSHGYIETAHSLISNHLLGCFEGLTVRSLTRNAVYRRFYKEKMLCLELSSIRTAWAVLKRACSLAAKLEVIAVDPLSGVGWKDFSSASEKPKSGRLKVDDLPTLAAEINRAQFNRRLFFTLQLCHATRINETCLAKWSNLYLDRGEWVIPAEDTKTGVELRLPLATMVVDLLRQAKARARGVFVFSRCGKKPIAMATASGWYKDLRNNMDVYFTSHDMRKLANDYWMQSGVDSTVRKMLLNHSRGNLEGRYESEYAWPLMKEAVERLAGEVVL
ncbi:tyrosine-type recombinase/integrase [Marinomonas spartinae]|uniref:tyrosine-type recombinase/integrase n=1 Tax=Marinomonas spartinae TaxID=1792290 RepID=UPI0018F17EF3|nr:tyrosine-type recombinase/integrase [Marinomonas spartinae]MBJ7555410.1 tyrosine-type recombinase/integrase [Marinomonas spartinae]